MNIEIVPEPKHEPPVLRDCEPGDVVKLWSGRCCVVITAAGIVEHEYTDANLAAVWLKDEAEDEGQGAALCPGYVHLQMIKGKGYHRIDRIVGKLKVTKESAE